MRAETINMFKCDHCGERFDSNQFGKISPFVDEEDEEHPLHVIRKNIKMDDKKYIVRINLNPMIQGFGCERADKYIDFCPKCSKRIIGLVTK